MRREGGKGEGIEVLGERRNVYDLGILISCNW